MFTTGVIMGLAEWIIDDTCLVENGFSMQLKFLKSGNGQKKP